MSKSWCVLSAPRKVIPKARGSRVEESAPAGLGVIEKARTIAGRNHSASTMGEVGVQRSRSLGSCSRAEESARSRADHFGMTLLHGLSDPVRMLHRLGFEWRPFLHVDCFALHARRRTIMSCASKLNLTSQCWLLLVGEQQIVKSLGFGVLKHQAAGFDSGGDIA